MFWKFGFHNASSIDKLLDNDDVALESILDEDDLLQECKAQNARLIDYFQRIDVLQRLLGYVTGDIEGEQKGRFKYPYVATEVLCSEIWSIVETCLSNSEQLLTPFWENVLDRTPEDMRTQNVMASQFSKINSVFLGKKPAEMLAFIQGQPSVVERLLRHVETPAFVDLLFRIIQLDEHPAGAGVLEWLSREKLIPRLVEFLSPQHSSAMHSVVSELVKGIISISAPSPGAGLTEGLQNGPASNVFARQLAQKHNISRLVGYMLDDISFECELASRYANGSQDAQASSSEEVMRPKSPSSPPIPNVDTATSSGVHAISIIIELIRKNNSDYFEPYLFHTLRNRLIQVQQHLHLHTQNGRETLERAMQEMVNRMGVVHLGPLLEVMSERLEQFQQLLHRPRSQLSPITTTVGQITPLTFERFRICELYAELLHCSNMSLLNRPAEFNHLYDSDGRLQGGLAALEELSRVIAIGSGQEEPDSMETEADEMEPAQELPISGASNTSIGSLDSDEDADMSDDDPSSSDDDVMEEIAMHDEHTASPPPMSPLDEGPLERPPVIVPSSPNAAALPPPSELAAQGAALARSRSASGGRSGSYPGGRPWSSSSRRSTRRMDSADTRPKGPLPVGDILKQRFTETRILTTLLDLFFVFPWNNFLHSTVYDVIHQILTGRVDSGLNRELTIALFRDARLMHRIVEGQTQNDIESEKRKGVRLGYMGHLTLISEDVIGALEHYPPELRLILVQYAPQPDWDDYVGGRYHETKKKDSSLLGGGKPVLASGAARGNGAARWRVDEADAVAPAAGTGPTAGACNGTSEVSEMTSEFRRTGRPTRESSADFGPATSMQEDIAESAGPQFARYLAQEISSAHAPTSDGSDDEDEDGGWLSQSRFDLAPPPISARNHNASRRPLSSGFEDAFDPGSVAGTSSVFDDQFGDDDDNFGPFSDAAASTDSDPFNINTSDADDNSFETFGDFGDFQAAEGELTPTADSWTFASVTSISSGSDDTELDDIDHQESSPADSRTATTNSRPS